MKPGEIDTRPPNNRKAAEEGMQADMGVMAAPFRSRWVFCGKDAGACQSMCQFIGDVSCGRLGCYCDSGL